MSESSDYDIDKENRKQLIRGTLVMIAFITFIFGSVIIMHTTADKIATTVQARFNVEKGE